MASSAEIPQDIIDNVIAAVGDNRRLLKQCALVSTSFLLPSRKRLFSNIFLTDELETSQKNQNLHQLFVQNPVMQTFVRSIEIDLGFSASETTITMDDTGTPSLLAILRLPFCCLESLSVTSSSSCGLRTAGRRGISLSSELKAALSNIVYSSRSTLKTLHLESVSNVPISLVLDIVHLTELELVSIFPEDFDFDHPSSLIPADSKGIATTAYPVIDQCMWYFWEPMHGTEFPMFVDCPLIQLMEGPLEPMFLPFMYRLRSLVIEVDPDSTCIEDFYVLSFLMRSLCVSLTSPGTLERLAFKILFRTYDNSFNVVGDLVILRAADLWKHIDSIITHPAGSRLKRVDISIDYRVRGDYVTARRVKLYADEIVEPVLDSLPLLREKGILFVEAMSS